MRDEWRDETAPRGSRRARTTLACGLALALGGCAGAGAPSLVLFGAYFPAWMFCALLGIVAAVAARALMLATGLAQVLPWQLAVCAAAGVAVATAAWLLWFGR